MFPPGHAFSQASEYAREPIREFAAVHVLAWIRKRVHPQPVVIIRFDVEFPICVCECGASSVTRAAWADVDVARHRAEIRPDVAQPEAHLEVLRTMPDPTAAPSNRKAVRGSEFARDSARFGASTSFPISAGCSGPLLGSREVTSLRKLIQSLARRSCSARHPEQIHSGGTGNVATTSSLQRRHVCSYFRSGGSTWSSS